MVDIDPTVIFMSCHVTQSFFSYVLWFWSNLFWCNVMSFYVIQSFFFTSFYSEATFMDKTLIFCHVTSFHVTQYFFITFCNSEWGSPWIKLSFRVMSCHPLQSFSLKLCDSERQCPWMKHSHRIMTRHSKPCYVTSFHVTQSFFLNLVIMRWDIHGSN